MQEKKRAEVDTGFHHNLSHISLAKLLRLMKFTLISTSWLCQPWLLTDDGLADC